MFTLKEKLASSKLLNRLLYRLPYNILNLRHKPRIIIEPTNYCNLSCELCIVNNGMTRKRGNMTIENFKKIINELSYVKTVDLFLAGEPLMNKDIFKMVRYAASKNIHCIISTNGTFLNKFDPQEIFDSGLKSMILALDGATEEIYMKYRKGGNFNLIIKNIKDLCEIKKTTKNKLPHIEIQFIVMKQNEHEISKMIELCKKLGVDSLTIKTLALGAGYYSNEALKKAQTFISNNEKYRRKLASKNLKICPWIWQSVVLWNGDITMCCVDYNGDYVIGNIFQEGGFKKIWKSRKYGEVRKKILNNEFEICKKCSLPSSEYSIRKIYF